MQVGEEGELSGRGSPMTFEPEQKKNIEKPMVKIYRLRRDIWGLREKKVVCSIASLAAL